MKKIIILLVWVSTCLFAEAQEGGRVDHPGPQGIQDPADPRVGEKGEGL